MAKARAKGRPIAAYPSDSGRLAERDATVSHVSIHRSTNMTNGRIEVITLGGAATTLERRREAAAGCRSAGAGHECFGGCARGEVHPSQLWGWRRQLRAIAARTGFAAVQVAAEAGSAEPCGGGAIEIELAAGARLRVVGTADPALLTAATDGQAVRDGEGEEGASGEEPSVIRCSRSGPHGASYLGPTPQLERTAGNRHRGRHACARCPNLLSWCGCPCRRHPAD
jgi:hypothetical protein